MGVIVSKKNQKNKKTKNKKQNKKQNKSKQKNKQTKKKKKTKQTNKQKTAITLLGIYQKETPSYHHKSTYSIMFIETLFIIARNWKQPRYPSITKRIKKCGTLTQWNTSQLLKTKII